MTRGCLIYQKCACAKQRKVGSKWPPPTSPPHTISCLQVLLGWCLTERFCLLCSSILEGAFMIFCAWADKLASTNSLECCHLKLNAPLKKRLLIPVVLVPKIHIYRCQNMQNSTGHELRPKWMHEKSQTASAEGAMHFFKWKHTLDLWTLATLTYVHIHNLAKEEGHEGGS